MFAIYPMFAIYRIPGVLMAALLLWAANPMAPAHAHVPDGRRLLQLLSDKLGVVDTMKVVQNLRMTVPGETQGMAGVSETLRYRSPACFRSDIQGPAIRRIFVENNDHLVTVTDDKVSFSVKTWFDRYKDLLFCRSASMMQIRLDQWGVDTSITSLGRINGTPVYVLGGQYPDKSASQVWIDKNSLLPLRWLVAEKGASGSRIHREIHFLNWEKSAGVWYPMAVQFFQGRRLVREIQARQITSNGPIGEEWFDIEALRGRFSPSRTPMDAETPIEEIRQTMKEFSRRFYVP